MSTSPKALRLDRLLGNMGYGSRAEIQALARTGRVMLDGQAVKDASTRVAIARELPSRLTVDGVPLDPPPGMVVMMNKPAGVTCSHKEAGPLVYGLLPPRWRRRDPAISTVGRLDKDTSGLLLLTDDGQFLHRVISPRSAVEKAYRATLARPLSGTEAAAFASGRLMLDGEEKPLLPARLRVVSPTEALVTVTEGRYHQVRRMFAAVGNHVSILHRVRVGGLSLPDDMRAGTVRVLDDEEIASVLAPPTFSS